MTDRKMIADLIRHLEHAVKEAIGWGDEAWGIDLEDSEWVIAARAKIAEAKRYLET